MINNKNVVSIEKLLNNEKIIQSKLLSDSFGICCFKLKTSYNKLYIVKFYKNNIKDFNAIKSENRNLTFFNEKRKKLFPIVYSKSDQYLIMSYIKNNGIQPGQTNDDLLNAIVSIHNIKNTKYGFNFDTQIGGLKQINKKSNNWVDFFRDHRLGYVFELINTSNKMEVSINKKIDFLLNNLENYIPKKPIASLLHGDLWEGNILFDNENFVGFIDPGSFYGHNELEIAYLRWFNPKFIDQNFLQKYSDVIKIDEGYKSYEPIYQLYYSLLNVYLWDREYVKDVKRLLNKI